MYIVHAYRYAVRPDKVRGVHILTIIRHLHILHVDSLYSSTIIKKFLARIKVHSKGSLNGLFQLIDTPTEEPHSSLGYNITKS